MIVFRAGAAGQPPQLFMRKTDQFDAVPIRGTDNAAEPFFSPDSQWIGFFANGKLKKIATSDEEWLHIPEIKAAESIQPGDWSAAEALATKIAQQTDRSGRNQTFEALVRAVTSSKALLVSPRALSRPLQDELYRQVVLVEGVLEVRKRQREEVQLV